MALLSKDIASKLLATPVKKPGVLSNIVKDKLVTSQGSVDQTKISPELEKVLPKPSKFGGLGESIAGISKKTGQAGDYLKRTGDIASYSSNPLISGAGKITKTTGELIGGVEDTRQNIINIGEKVKQGKITKAEGIIEAGTSAGLEGITLIAAPFIQAINSGLKVTGLDKPLEAGISGGTDFLVNLTSNVFGLSEDKARSRVNSSLNVLRGLSMYKGGQIINKGGGLNFVKGSAVMNSPDLALSVLALGAKDEGKDLPTPEVLKGIATNTALTFVGKPTAKPKLSAKIPKQTTISDIPTKNKIDLGDEVLNQKADKVNKLKEEYEKFDFLGKTQKIVDKYGKGTKEANLEYRKLQSERDNLLGKLNTAREDYLGTPEGTFNKQKVPKLSEQPLFLREKKGEMVFNEDYHRSPAKFTNSKGIEIQGFLLGNDYGGKIRLSGVDGKDYSITPDKISLIDKITQTAKDFETPKKTQPVEQKTTPKLSEKVLKNTRKSKDIILVKDIQEGLSKTKEGEIFKINMPGGTEFINKGGEAKYSDFGVERTDDNIISGLKETVETPNLSEKVKEPTIDDIVNEKLSDAEIKDLMFSGKEKTQVKESLGKLNDIQKTKALFRKKDTIDSYPKYSEIKNLTDNQILVFKGVDKANPKLYKFEFTPVAKEFFNIGKDQEIPFMKKGVHYPIDLYKQIKNKEKNNKGKKLSEIVTEKPATTETIPVEKPVEEMTPNPIVSEEVLAGGDKALTPKVEKEKFPLTQGLKVHLNKLRQLTQKVKLGGAEKVLVDNIRGLLDNIVLTDKTGTRRTASYLVDGIIGEARNFREKIMNSLGFNDLRKLEDTNTQAINAGYDFVQKNKGKYLPKEGIENIVRREGTTTAQNELFKRTAGEQGKNSTKNRVLFDFVGSEIMQRVKNFEKAEKKAIKAQFPDPKQQKVMLDEYELSPTKVQEFVNEVISELPKESQGYVKNVFDKYGQFGSDSIVQKGFKDIAENYPELLPYLKENYYHGYVSGNKLQAYFKETGGDLNAFLTKYEADSKSVREYIRAIKEGTMPSPEQMASILKRSNDVWYLHSYNPLDVVNSYATELSKLKEQREILNLFDELGKKDLAVKQFIDENLVKDDNYVNRKLLGINKYSPGIRAAREISRATAVTKYVGNTAMIVQNLTFGALQGLARIMYNELTGKAKYGGISGGEGVKGFVDNTIGSTREYLFNQGLLGHKNFDIDKNLFSNVPLSRKVIGQVRDIIPKGLRYFTATLVPQIQSIVASGYMNNIVSKLGGGIKKGETLPDAFKRTLNSLSETERRDIFGELSKQVTSIEDNTRLSGATHSIFDMPLFNMVKGFNRQNLSTIFHNMTDSLDAVVKIGDTSNKNNKATRTILPEITGKDRNQIISNITSLSARTVAMYAAVSVIANMFFDDENEKEKFIEYTFAKDLKNYVLNLALSPIGVPGLDMVAGNIDAFIQGIVGIYNAEGSEAKTNEAEKMLLNIFTGIKKSKESIQNAMGDFQRHESKQGGYTYTDVESTSPLGTFMGINPASSAYSNLYSKLDEEKANLPQDISEKISSFLKTIKIFDSLSQNLSISKKVLDAKLKTHRTQVDNMNRRINDRIVEKMTFDEFLDNALGEEATSERGELFKKNFKDKYIKNISTNLGAVNKLSRVVEGVNNVKRTPTDFEDMNDTLRKLAEVNPKLYHQFYSELYNSISGGMINPEVAESDKAFVSNIINRDMNGALLSTVIADKLDTLSQDIISKNKGVVTDYTTLESLNKVIGTLNESPDLKKQIYDSLSQKIQGGITEANIKNILNAVRDYPEIYDLYKRNLELRGATFLNKENTPEEAPTPTPETPKGKEYGTVSTNKTEIGTLPTYSEKKKQKLSDLITIRPRQATFPQLSKIPLDTMLDKILKK